MTRKNFAEMISNQGGRAYLVGGCVRDFYRRVQRKDHDYAVTGLTEKQFTDLFPEATRVAKSFPVYLLEIDGQMSEVAFARQEWKSGMGYQGFEFKINPEISIEEDLSRRDTTMNAMAIDILTRDLIDPFNGIAAIMNGYIKAVNDHFCDDPVRALRAARQSAQFGYIITHKTIRLMHKCKVELFQEPAERIFKELEKALATDKPSLYFRALAEADILRSTYPEVDDLIGVPQPELYHPEGDVFEHTMQVLDKVSKVTKDVRVRFAALCHDLGKALSPEEELPHHYKHEFTGLDVLDKISKSWALPNEWKKSAYVAIKRHMHLPYIKKERKMVPILFDVAKSPIGFSGFNTIIQADTTDPNGLPVWLEKGEEIMRQLKKVKGTDAPKEVLETNSKLIGDWILGERARILKGIIKHYKEEK